MHSLESFSLSGFRSIKEANDFTLGPITVLVGANGAGKSNLIGFFRMLNAMVQGGLQVYLQEGNGASNFLHFGPARTRLLTASVEFRNESGLSAYRFEQSFAAVDRLIFTREEVSIQPTGDAVRQVIALENAQPTESCFSRQLYDEDQPAEVFIKSFLDKVRVFHFHDTSVTSRMRNTCDRDSNSHLRNDGGNLAAVLLRLRREFPSNYRRIVSGVNAVFPELKDFFLEPTTETGAGLLLRWRPSSNPSEIFGPAHLSDGSLRMIALVTLFNLPEAMSPWMIILDEPELGLHPAAESYLASLIRSVSANTQVLLSTQSATLVDHFEPSEIVVTEVHDGATTFERLNEEALNVWLQRYTLGEAWRKNVFGGRPE